MDKKGLGLQRNMEKEAEYMTVCDSYSEAYLDFV